MAWQHVTPPGLGLLPGGPPSFRGGMAPRVTPMLVEGGAEFAEARKLSQARRTRGWAGPVKCWVESRVEAQST